MRGSLRSSGDNPLTQSGGWKVMPDASTPAAAPGGVPQTDETAPASEAEAKADEEEMHAEEEEQGDEGGLRAMQGTAWTEAVPLRQKTSAARRSRVCLMRMRLC